MKETPSIEEQKNAQYLAIGKFVVEFEHLFFAMKVKFKMLCGMHEEVALILEKLTVKQSIEALNDIVFDRMGKQKSQSDDILLLKNLIKDLRYIAEYRNSIVHTMWLIGWRSQDQKDISQFSGYKFSGTKNFKVKSKNVEDLEYHTEIVRSLYKVFFTAWLIDRLNTPSLSDLYKRSKDRIWTRK